MDCFYDDCICFTGKCPQLMKKKDVFISFSIKQIPTVQCESTQSKEKKNYFA